MASRIFLKLAGLGIAASMMAGVACTKNPDQTKMQYVPDMADSAALKSQRDFLQPPEGTVTRTAILYPSTIEEAEKTLQNPITASAEATEQGKKLWNKFCTPCHGALGDSNGSITDVYPKPPNLVAKDYPAQVLMHWFINEQVEEEAWAGEMVDRIQSATCAGSLSDLDRHIERLLEQGITAEK